MKITISIQDGVVSLTGKIETPNRDHTDTYVKEMIWMEFKRLRELVTMKRGKK